MPVLRTMTWDEPKAVSDVLKYELSSEYCHDVATILSGAGALEIGTVLGKITAGWATAEAKAGGNAANTGAITMDPTSPVRPGAKAGVYTVRCIAAASNSGTFEVKDPDGFSLGQVVVGATFDNDIKFSIADGGQDFVVGEGFDVTVPQGSKKWKKHGSGAGDGTDVAAGVLLQKVDATSGDKSAVILARGPAVVSRLGLIWDSSIDSDAKKAASIEQLAKIGILVRDSA